MSRDILLYTAQLDELYSKIRKKIVSKEPKILYKVENIPDCIYKDSYPSEILERNYLKELLVKAKLVDDRGISIRENKVVTSLAGIRKFTTYQGELLDTLFPVVKSGLTFEGKRMAKQKKATVPTELFEYSFISEIPKVIYFMMNKQFDEELFWAQYTDKEQLMMKRLFLDMMKSCLFNKGMSMLNLFMHRDPVLRDFILNMEEFKGKIRTETDSIKIPRILGEQNIPNDLIKVVDKFSFTQVYIRSILINIFSAYINGILEVESGIQLRSLDTFRVILEVDEEFKEKDIAINITTNNGFIFKPSREKINMYSK